MHLNHRVRVKLEADDESAGAVGGGHVSRVRTGSNAKHSTCTAFCSQTTRTCGASSPITASRVTRCGRTSRLVGNVEVRYDPEQQRVVYEPVKLTQAYRNFDFLSPVGRHPTRSSRRREGESGAGRDGG